MKRKTSLFLPITATAQDYIDAVATGQLTVGPWIKKAIQRHINDLKRTDIHFDPTRGQRVIDFCEKFCTPPAQKTKMQLMPWQKAILMISYGWLRLDGSRRFRRVYLEVAKKNGKTGLSAALAIYHLVADGEMSARVFTAATTLGQAKLSFTDAVSMRDNSPDLSSLIQKNGNSPVIALYVPTTGSRLSAMTRGQDSQDGAIISAAILDELHRWKKSDSLWSILRYGGDTRKQPMLVCITTAGASAGKSSLCWEEHEYVTHILDGVVVDDEVAGFIFSLGAKDVISDESNWSKPNPSLGYILPLTALQNQFKEVMGKPTAMGEYKRYRLNVWTDEVSDPAIDIEVWDECSVENLKTHPDKKRLRKEMIARLQGRTCFGAVDLAPKIDTSALVLIFPPVKTGDKWEILEWFWCPEDDISERTKRDRVPYDVWKTDGFITATPGNLTDVRYISDQITSISQQFNLKEIYYDQAWSSELIRMLGESGFAMNKLVSFPQTHLKMNSPCQEFMRKVIGKELHHAANPVMRWQMSNLRWNTQFGSGFVMPARGRKREKIDGAASLIMAIASATSPDNIVKPKAKFWAVTSA